MPQFAYVPVVPGPVKETFRGDALFEMHPGTACHWYQSPNWVKQGDLYDGDKADIPFRHPPGEM